MEDKMTGDKYNTLKSEAQTEHKVKGSRFIGYAFPVVDQDEIEEKLNEVRKEHFKARHHCFAYKLGFDDNVYRYNDDGEPSGTAGKPIYGQIIKHDIRNVLIIVVRYFGGTKLGTSGLISAYRTAASEAINESGIIQRINTGKIQIDFEYSKMGDLMNLLKNLDFNIVETNFQLSPFLKIEVEKSKLQDSIRLLKSKWLNIDLDHVNDDIELEEIEFKIVDSGME